jgi:hypothetical protein
MTDISVQYYKDEEWVSLVANLLKFKVEDYGINRVPQATLSMFGKASDLSDYLTAPYQLMRIRANPSSWQTLFYGYVDNPRHKALRGTLTDIRRLSLDCFGWQQRLVNDTVTFDYYALQSALLPKTDSAIWTFREVMEDFLEYPDTRAYGALEYDIPLSIIASNDTDGIDHAVDASCSFNRNTIFEAIRTICDRIGYDGKYNMTDEFVMQLYLYPFDKSPVTTLSNPYIKEPEYEGGSLDDIVNIIYVTGGIDAGVPSDGDRWTEYAATKYDPAIWSATRTGDTPTVTDVDNDTIFTNENLAANNKCIKVTTTGSTNQHLHTFLDLTNTEAGSIDALNRVTKLIFSLKVHVNDETPRLRSWYMNLFLVDSSDNKILYRYQHSTAINEAELFPTNPALGIEFEKAFYLDIGAGILISDNKDLAVWSHETGTTFDWEHIVTFEIQLSSKGVMESDTVWGIYLDGLQFVGGYRIDPSNPLNPPIIDGTSITAHGIHPYSHIDNQINSFEQAQAEGTRLVANLKNPISKLTLTKELPTTQLYPSNVVTVSGVDYRVYGVIYEWDTAWKDVHATYKLVGKTSPLPPIWTEQNEMRYLIK